MSDALISVDDALTFILSAVPGPTEPEWVYLSDALGRVAAADVSTTIDLPPWDNRTTRGDHLQLFGG